MVPGLPREPVNPSLPPGIDQVLERALSRFPSNVFRTCTEFTAALEKALCGQGAVEKKIPAPETAKVLDTDKNARRCQSSMWAASRPW